MLMHFTQIRGQREQARTYSYLWQIAQWAKFFVNTGIEYDSIINFCQLSTEFFEWIYNLNL